MYLVITRKKNRKNNLDIIKKVTSTTNKVKIPNLDTKENEILFFKLSKNYSKK
jgi:hypothetical protein